MGYPELIDAETGEIRRAYNWEAGDAEKAVDAFLRVLDYDDESVASIVDTMRRFGRQHVEMMNHDCTDERH